VVTGQKVWTSLAHWSQWCFVLARTTPRPTDGSGAGAKHKGLSYLLVPMDQDGIEIRPIVQLTGDSEFNEVFFDGARTPADNVVGGEGEGWRVAMGTLAFERGASTLGQQLGFRTELDGIVAAARRNGRIDDPVIRQRLAQAHIGLEVMRLNALRTLAGSERGALGRDAMIGKLYWATVHRGLGELAVDVLGPEAMVCGDEPAGPADRGAGPHYDPTLAQRVFLYTRADTIYGGSNQIQRNIIGERALGLPKEPR
jgi:alkylation response protein AidB-like acyl-CoA dehydrogenase